MKKLQIYLSYFLLMAFAWVITPAQTIHDLFADHHDTEDNYCLLYHSHLGTHIEEQHTHCDILKLNSPAYSLPERVVVNVAVSEINTLLSNYELATLKSSLQYNLPSRAPPVI